MTGQYMLGRCADRRGGVLPVVSVGLALLTGGMLLAAGLPPRASHGDDPLALPDAPREFRGAWIATVGNLDWPSQPGLPTAVQQEELIALLDRAVALNLNAIILQVRPSADAFYASPYEPWSEFLTGEMGRAPEPFYDPLAFAVEEAHRRGLELHAWFNPFRARHPMGTSAVSADHISRTRPELVRTYGRWQWLDPGEPDVRAHALQVILDVVNRYDIDGVHLDDYFYPYPERNDRRQLLAFPDDASWMRAQQAGVRLSRDDWRRQNVDRFVERLYRQVKQAKPWVKVGISPFGIWRPRHPEQIKGLDAYAELYADARKWLRHGWLDYCVPQLYWKIGQAGQSYPVLLAWWQEQNALRRHLWPGNFTNKVGAVEGERWQAAEILEQIRLTRAQPGARGNVHFSIRALAENRDALADQLVAGAYAQPALVPASAWLGDEPPPVAPQVSFLNTPDGLLLTMEPGRAEAVRHWIVRARYGTAWTLSILPGWVRTRLLGEPGAVPDEVAVSAVDRVGNEGAVAAVLPRRAGARDARTF
jgi:uncharacterized lipoprotein YddW (UPF0748 family)